MFTADRRAPGDQRGVAQPGSPRLHLRPWLHKGLKTPHLNRDIVGMNGTCQQAKTGLTYLDRTLSRTRGLGFGFLSRDKVDLPGRGKTEIKKKVSNGLGLGRGLGLGPDRTLPEVLQDVHVRPESRRGKTEASPAKCSQPPEPEPEPGPGPGPGAVLLRMPRLGQGLRPSLGLAPGTASEPGQGLHSGTSVTDYYTDVSFVGNHLNPPRTEPHPPDRKLELAPVAATAWFKGQTNCGAPVRAEGEKVWVRATTPSQKELRSSPWVRSYSQGGGENNARPALSSSTSGSSLEQGRGPPVLGGLWRQRELQGPSAADHFNGPSSLQRVIFSTEVPHRDKGALTPRSHDGQGPRSELLQPRPGRQDQRPRMEAGPGVTRCSRRELRDQIGRVMDSLENVLGGLKDVHQEMKEVVQQIEYLTSSIDLSEEEPSSSSLPSPSSSTSSSSGVAMGPGHHRHPGLEPTQGDMEPPSSLAVSPWVLHNPGSSPRRAGPTQPPLRPPGPQDESRDSELCSLTRMNHTLCRASCSPRSSPGRPPTPGLSPIQVKINQSRPPPSPSLNPLSRRRSPLPPQPPLSPVSPLALLPPLSPLPLQPLASPPLSPVSPLALLPPLSPLQLQPLASPPLSPLPQPPTLGPSVRAEYHLGSTQTPHGEHPSARTIPPSPSPPPPTPGSPHKDLDAQPGRDRHLGTAGSSPASLTQDAASPLRPGPGRAPGPRGRKPPPYPHDGHQERVRKGKEPRREAPPYPVKRRLLSTTV